MKRVIQEDSTGCGLACIAMMVGTRYKTIKKQAHELLHDWPSGPRSFYTEPTHLKTLLKAHSIEYGHYRRTSNWRQIKAELAIAAINLQKNGNWHWVVFKQQANDAYILDPRAKQEKRRDFGRAKLHAYLPIRLTEHLGVLTHKIP
ncbi:cysteine peptidase family C39 domain-containing protein [Viridibacterium curvum]|uniref:Peptidase C39 domain-containing protein n=1 Tax=Viridibacterium curvum TaxID=1101404 RepID=A0ABP9R6N5_9RHOO